MIQSAKHRLEDVTNRLLGLGSSTIVLVFHRSAVTLRGEAAGGREGVRVTPDPPTNYNNTDDETVDALLWQCTRLGKKHTERSLRKSD